MEMKRKCAICGYEFSYRERVEDNPFVLPHSDGARYYYNLWHYPVEICPNCGYACKAVGQTLNKHVVEDEKYLEIDSLPMILELNDARPNEVAKYMKAAYYYESVGEDMDNIKCLLQAGDQVFAEMMYWDEYVLDNSDRVSTIVNNAQFDGIRTFGEYLINTAIERLEAYIKEHNDDIDAIILLAGTLSDGDRIQAMKSVKLLTSLKSMPLSLEQKKAVEFLMEGIN